MNETSFLPKFISWMFFCCWVLINIASGFCVISKLMFSWVLLNFKLKMILEKFLTFLISFKKDQYKSIFVETCNNIFVSVERKVVSTSFVFLSDKVSDYLESQLRSITHDSNMLLHISLGPPMIIIDRSSHLEVFCRKGVLRNFAKFTGKRMCQSLIFKRWILRNF